MPLPSRARPRISPAAGRAATSSTHTGETDEQRHERHREALLDLTRSLGATGQYDADLRLIVKTAADALGTDHVSVWKFNTAHTACRCVLAYERAADRFSSGGEISQADHAEYFRAIAELDVLAADCAPDDPRTREFVDDHVRPAGIGAMLVAPVHAAGKRAGVLCHETFGGSRMWKADEKTFAIALANLVALTMAGQERSHARQQLRQTKDLLQRAIDAGKVGLASWDISSNTVSFSTEWKRHLGYDDDAFGGSIDAWKALVHPDDRERVASALEQVMTGRSASYDLEYRIRRSDGSYSNVLSSGSLESGSGADRRLVSTHIDVTRLNDLQMQLLQAQKMESVGRLAGGIAHDFNNLLTVINGTADIALASLSEEHPLRADLVEIQKAGDRASQLTRQLLAFSRQQVLKPEVLSLNDVVGNMEGMLTRLLGEDVHLLFKPGAPLSLVEADRGQLEQVVMNLAVNARDAMPRGGALTIETADVDLDAEFASTHRTVKPGPHVMLAVSDSGAGMDASVRARVFEPFFTTKGRLGTGLGLSTVYGIVKQSGGSIWVYSEVGHGTVFKIYLPRTESAPEARRPARSAVTMTGSETILVVEDEDAVRKLVVRMLQSAGYLVLEAGTGEQAQAVAERHPDRIDLVLTDIVMPGMTGPELSERLEKMRPDTKVLFTSGYTDGAILRQDVLEQGAHFVAKPYAKGDLLRKVREALDL